MLLVRAKVTLQLGSAAMFRVLWWAAAPAGAQRGPAWQHLGEALRAVSSAGESFPDTERSLVQSSTAHAVFRKPVQR